MSPASSESPADWPSVCRRSVQGLRRMLAEHPSTRERAVETGLGEGGDQALVIDRGAEDIVFAELEGLHAQGHRFCALSEERGEVDFGDPATRVVIDPIDGSMNAKRGLRPYALSIAVASGTTMADVCFGYVYDLGAGEEWMAWAGSGAYLDGRRLGAAPPERRVADGRLELVAIESANPRWVQAAAGDLGSVAHRLRAVGSIAISLCQVACTRVDAMATLWRCRSVDAAAAQLIVRESGGHVAFSAFEDPLAAPLDLEPHSPVLAARTEQSLDALRCVPVRE